MSIIVGVEATVKPYSAVIAADTRAINGRQYELLPSMLGWKDSDHEIILGQLEKGIQTGTFHKIFVSPSRDTMLAFTGITDKLFEDIKGFLFEGPEHLSRKSGVAYYKNKPIDRDDVNPAMEMITPFAYKRDSEQRAIDYSLNPEIVDSLWNEYFAKFSLIERLLAGYVPEIREIVNVRNREELRRNGLINADNPYFEKPRWEENGAYLFATGAKVPGNELDFLSFDKSPLEEKFLVFPIRSWGLSRRAQPFSAFGSGGQFALEFLNKELGIDPNGLANYEIIPNLEIDSERAVKLATKAVEYANQRDSIFCGGLDYAILTKDGVDKHFSDEETSGTIDMTNVIKANITALEQELLKLKKINYALDERAKKRDSTQK